MAFNVSYNFIANNSFSGVAKQIKKSTDRVRKAVKSTGKQLAITDGVTKRVGKSMKSSFGKMSKAGLKSSKILNKAHQSTGKQLVKVKNIANAVTTSVDADFKQTASVSASSFRKINRFINSARKALEKFKKTTAFRKMRVQVRILRKDFKRLGKTIRKSMSQSGKGFRNFIVGAGIIVGLKKAVTVGADFQDSLADLSAITGATGKDLALLTDETLRLAKGSAIAQTEVAAAIKIVGSQKSELLSNIPALIAVTDKVLLLKNAAGIELADAANIATTSMNIFGAKASEVGKFVDIMAQGSVVGASSIAETGEAIIIAGGAARSAGLSFKDLNVLLQTTSRGGFTAARAGTALNSILGRLQRGKKGVFAGVDFEKANLQQVFIDIKKTMDAFPDSVKRAQFATELFGEEHQKVGFALLNNVELIGKFGRSITKSGVAQKQAELRLGTFNSKMRKLGVIIKDKIIRLFQRLEPMLTSLAVKFGKWIDSITPDQINKFAKDLKIFIKDAVELGKTIAMVMKNAFNSENIDGFKSSLGDVLEALGLISKAIIGTGKAFKSVGTGIGETVGAVETGNVSKLVTEKFAQSLDFFGIIDIKKIKAESAARKVKEAVKPPSVPNLTIVQSFPDLFPSISAALPPLTPNVINNIVPDVSIPDVSNVVSIPNVVTSPLIAPLIAPLVMPPVGPTVNTEGDSKSTIDININAPRDTVRSVQTRDVGVGKKLNVGVNMKEAI